MHGVPEVLALRESRVSLQAEAQISGEKRDLIRGLSYASGSARERSAQCGFFAPRGLGLATRDDFRICATFGSLTRRLVPSMPIGSLAAGVASSASTSFSLRGCIDVPIGLGACRLRSGVCNSIPVFP